MADDREDGTLLRDYLAGDHSAFDVLVRRHQTWMWVTAQAMLGGQDDAMDVVQLAFVRAFRSAHTWRGDGPVTAWLYRIVCRVAVTMHNARARRPTPIETQDNPYVEELVSRDDEGRDSGEQTVREVVLALPDDQRECLVRTLLLGFSVSEVAADLGVAEGTVRSRRVRAKAQLVNVLADAGLVGPGRSRDTPSPPTDRPSDPKAWLGKPPPAA